MPNPTEFDRLMGDHEHHKTCATHAHMCPECPDIKPTLEEQIRNRMEAGSINTFKRPTYRHTAKPPWVDFEKQRELVPDLRSGDQVPENHETSPVRLQEKITTCRITFEDREPDRSDSGKAITIHQCEVHLVIITWDES